MHRVKGGTDAMQYENFDCTTGSRTRQCIRTYHNHLTAQGQHNQVEASLARCDYPHSSGRLPRAH